MGLTVSESGKTRILIFGAQAWSVSQLFDYLESANLSLGNNSISIATAVLDLQAQWFNGTINSLKQRVGDIEDTTGMRKPINHEDLQQPAQDWKDLDMVPITGELSSLLSRISFLKMQAETALYLIQRMHHHAGILTDKTVGRLGYPDHEDYELFNRLESTRGWFIGLIAQCDYLARRTSAQLQGTQAHNVYETRCSVQAEGQLIHVAFVVDTILNTCSWYTAQLIVWLIF